MKRLSLILLFYIVFFDLSAQNYSNSLSPNKKLNQFSIDNWTKDNGLPTNSLVDLCQSDDGYLWITSYNGLIRFDGINFKVYNDLNTDVFLGNGVGAISKDKKGTLWITTQNSGLISYKNGKFKSYGIDESIIHLYSEIFIDSKDRIWSSCLERGWFIFKDGKFTFFDEEEELKNIDLLTVAEAPNGDIWMGTAGDGLFKYENNKFHIITEKEGLISNWIRTIHFQDTILWVGTEKGMCIYNGKEFFTCNELKGASVKKIISDNYGNLWIATTKGLYRKNRILNEYERLTTETGLKKDYVGNILIDYENNLWINNYKAGLSRLKNSKFIFYNEKKGLKGKIVNSICEINPGEYLTAFDNGYINKIKEGKIFDFKTKNSLIGKRIRNIYKDSKNNIWISTYAGLLKIFPDKSEKWYTNENGFPGKYIRLVFEDSKNNDIWVGTRHSGVIRINKDNTYTTFDKSNGLAADLIMSIDEDKKGNILVGTSKGGLNIIKNDTTIKIYNLKDGITGDVIFNTYTDKDGYIWVAANGGLNCLKEGNILSYNINDSNIYDSPYDILEDKSGNFWMPCGLGIIKIKRQDLIDIAEKKSDDLLSILYDTHDGLEQPECNSTAISLKADDGTLWFPTIDGIATINPDKISTNTYEPPVFIEEFIVDNNQIEISEDIILKSKSKRFIFNYTALSLQEPKDVLFRFKLEGFDEEWSESKNNRTISYTNLSPGDYTFKVIACNNDGFWNKKGDLLKFTIEPTIFETVWFYLILFLIMVSVVFFLYRLRVKTLLKRQKSLEFLVRKRTKEIIDKNEEILKQNEKLQRYQDELEEKIRVRTYDLQVAKDNAEKADKLKTVFLENLSHEIRTPLNAIVGYSSILKDESVLPEKEASCIDHIDEGSNALIKIIDSIMYASRIQLGDISINRTKFSLHSLMNDIYKEFIKSNIYNAKKHNVDLRYNSDNLQKIELYTDIEIFKTILLNLIENAIKYTEKGFVEYGLNNTKGRFTELYVKDTGIGISKEDINYIFDKFRKIETDKKILYSGLGLGLTISESLCKLLEGKLSVNSEPGKGTIFYIMIPIKSSR